MDGDSVALRLREYLSLKSWTAKDFERITGLGNGTCARIGDSTRSTTYNRISKSGIDLNIEWLRTGEGEMLKSGDIQMPERRNKTKDSQMLIPLIHVDGVGGMRSSNLLSSSEQYVERLVPFPDARQGDVAILQSGNSMSPTIPPGAILQIRRVEGWREYFGYGNDFVLWLEDDRRITKQVLKCDEDPKNYIVCHSYNPEVADEELPKSMIQEVWKVVNVLINKGW